MDLLGQSGVLRVLNGAASISQRTGGFRQPLSRDACITLRTSSIGPLLRLGVKPRSLINKKAAARVRPSRTVLLATPTAAPYLM
jgi:hypothetical protein